MKSLKYFLLGIGLILFGLWAAALGSMWLPFIGGFSLEFFSFAAAVAGLVFLIIGFCKN